MGGRHPSAAATSRTERPPIADTRITIVIRPYLLRWPRREESETPIKQRRAKHRYTCVVAPELVRAALRAARGPRGGLA